MQRENSEGGRERESREGGKGRREGGRETDATREQ